MNEEELKSVTFSDDDVKENVFFMQGVHSVIIKKATIDKNKAGKPFIQLDVEGENGEEGSARRWFTGAATPYTIDTIRKIFVHNAKNEDDKQKLRDFFKTVKTLYDIAQIKDRLIGKQCWFTLQKSDDTYIDENGDEKNSYDKNFWGYEPTLKTEKKPVKREEPSQDVVLEDVDDSPIDLSEIPF